MCVQAYILTNRLQPLDTMLISCIFVITVTFEIYIVVHIVSCWTVSCYLHTVAILSYFLFLGAHVRAVSLPLRPASTLSLYLSVSYTHLTLPTNREV